MRRCKPGCYLIRDSNDPQYLFTLQQTIHFVGPCATRIAFIQVTNKFRLYSTMLSTKLNHRDYFASKTRQVSKTALEKTEAFPASSR